MPSLIHIDAAPRLSMVRPLALLKGTRLKRTEALIMQDSSSTAMQQQQERHEAGQRTASAPV